MVCNAKRTMSLVPILYEQQINDSKFTVERNAQHQPSPPVDERVNIPIVVRMGNRTGVRSVGKKGAEERLQYFTEPY